MTTAISNSMILKLKIIIKCKAPEYFAMLLFKLTFAQNFLPKLKKLKSESIYYRAKPYQAVYKFPDGLKLFSPKSDSLNQHARLGFRYYEPKTRSLSNHIAKTLDKNSLIIDVGAYNGIYAIPLAIASQATVLSFEPNFANFKLLLKNIELNNLQSKILPMYLALSDKNKFGYVTESNSELATIFEFPIETLYKQAVFRMDDIIELLPSMPIRLIKIDVEGMGSEVLNGARVQINKYYPYIIIESLSEEESIKQASLLTYLGYKPSIKLGDKYGDQRNFLYVHPESYPKIDLHLYELN
jgi:FkbM family methyltransferase